MDEPNVRHICSSKLQLTENLCMTQQSYYDFRILGYMHIVVHDKKIILYYRATKISLNRYTHMDTNFEGCSIKL